MGLLVDETKLQGTADEVVDRLDKALTSDAIPAAGAELAKVTAALAGTVQSFETSLQQTADMTIDALTKLLSAQDGWTVTIQIPPIVIPPITITLNRPK